MLEHLPKRIRKRLQPNGCTMFLEGAHSSCCDIHDHDYAMGIDRKEADQRLKKCIRLVREEQYEMDTKAGKNFIWLFLKYKSWRILAVLMYAAVRTFGWYFWERGRWFRESKPSGDNWWVIGRLKMRFLSKYK